MLIVADAAARTAISDRGGRLYLWPRATRCCGGRQWLLESSTEPGGESARFAAIHDEPGLEVMVRAGMATPDELHIELARTGELRAYWNGLGWIA